MEFVVDVQGYYTNEFILKEITILSCDYKLISHFILKPPFPWHSLDQKYKRQAIWLYRHHHGLRWSDGFVDYYEFMNQQIYELLKEATVIYVKGNQKYDFLSSLNLNATIVDVSETSSLKKYISKKRCLNHHKNDGICSTDNAYKINFILKNDVC